MKALALVSLLLAIACSDPVGFSKDGTGGSASGGSSASGGNGPDHGGAGGDGGLGGAG